MMHDAEYKIKDKKHESCVTHRVSWLMNRASCIVHRDRKGVTLVELMITLVIFSVVISMIYSVFNAFLKQATSERKVAKTEMDVIAVAWPLLKEIETAGFGVPKYDCTTSTTQCACGLTVADRDSDGVNDLIIHSTAASDDQDAGKWSYIGTSGTTCTVTNMYASTSNDLVVISNTDKSHMGAVTVNSSNELSSCGSKATNVAYWIPSTSYECYETIYSLQPYGSGERPAICEPNTRRLARSVQTDNTPYFATMLDCVFGADSSSPADLGFNYRFGCISSSGNLTWQTGTNCGTSKLRFVKIGFVVQSSTRRDVLSTTPITLFEGLRDSVGNSLAVAIDLTTDQRYYKWRKVEQTITLKNLE